MDYTFVFLGGFPNNKKMMQDFSKKQFFEEESTIILEIPRDKYYSNQEIVQHLYVQLHSHELRKNLLFVLHDFGSIYGKLLVTKLAEAGNHNLFVEFLSIGPYINIIFSFKLFYILYNIFVFFLYSLYKPLGNFFYRVLLCIIYSVENIPKKHHQYFLTDASLCYVYYNALMLDLNRPMPSNVVSHFIRGNTIDKYFDKSQSADVEKGNHWFFL
jgi:hypothetical protein